MKWKVGMSVTYTGTEDGEMFTSVKDVKKASKLLKILS